VKTFHFPNQGFIKNRFNRRCTTWQTPGNGAMEENMITSEKIEKVRKLNVIAQQRGQSLAQMALAWIIKDPRVTSVLIGVSKPNR
jgi:aryl-alcohol dehydrogenase-like predicted oxidoreductase